MVIKANPVSNDTIGVLQTLKALPVHALLFEGAYHPLYHPILLWAVRRDELLLQTIAFGQGCVAAAGKYQAIVRSQQEALLNTPQTAITTDEGLL